MALGNFRVSNLPATKHNRYLDLITVLQKLPGPLCLYIKVVLVNLGTKLDLLDGSQFLFLARFAVPFALLVLEFTVIHEATDGWPSVRCYIDKVQPLLTRQLQGFISLHCPKLIAFPVDYQDLPGPYLFINEQISANLVSPPENIKEQVQATCSDNPYCFRLTLVARKLQGEKRWLLLM